MGEVTAEYMEVFCNSRVVKRCDAFSDYVGLHPGFILSDSCYKAIEPLNVRKDRQDLCPQINADEHG